VQFGIGFLIISGYFLSNFLMARKFTANNTNFTAEMKKLASVESDFTFVQNAEKEFLYGAEVVVLGDSGQVTWKEAPELLLDLYPLYQDVVE